MNQHTLTHTHTHTDTNRLRGQNLLQKVTSWFTVHGLVLCLLSKVFTCSYKELEPIFSSCHHAPLGNKCVFVRSQKTASSSGCCEKAGISPHCSSAL